MTNQSQIYYNSPWGTNDYFGLLQIIGKELLV